jgi:hypothetical protein
VSCTSAPPICFHGVELNQSSTRLILLFRFLIKCKCNRKIFYYTELMEDRCGCNGVQVRKELLFL